MVLPLEQNRLVRQEVAAGFIRAYEPPQEHIGTRLIAPFLSVGADEVIFEYLQGLVAGLAPARAEDAESELAQRDETVGYGRAAVVDWALKDTYSASDVTRYRDILSLQGAIEQGNFPLTVGNVANDFQRKLARDTARRLRKLSNRLEWMIMSALETGKITYDDGEVAFEVDFQRPAAQTSDTVTTNWDQAAADPIGDLLAIQETAYNTYGVQFNRAIISRKILNAMMTSDKFTNQLTGANPLYTVAGWGPDAAAQIVSQQTGIEFLVYESVYRTRAIGSTTPVNTRFLSDNHVILLPSEADLQAIDDTDIGFASTLTAPHPEAEWGTGFYQFEYSEKDPWRHNVGNGIKAFPVFPHLEYTWDLVVL